MNFIRKITIENFQSHQKTICVPAPCGQLTVITGPSDSGKTAILRALRWLFVNEPDGDSFIRVGATFARVTAEHEDGTIIRHRTSGGTNRYIANGEKLEGFGRGGVPLEVKEITGVRPVKIGDLEFNLNIAEQLSGPFLGSSVSAPARAKVLGKLAGTEEIDYANQLLGTDLHRRNQDEKRLTGKVEGLEEEVKRFDWLPRMAWKIEALEALVTKIRLARERLMQLEHKRDRYNETEENIYECLVKVERWKGLGQAERLAGHVDLKRNGKEKLIFLENHYQIHQEHIQDYRNTIAQHANLPQAEKMLPVIMDNQGQKESLASLATRYRTHEQGIQANRDIVSRHTGLSEAEALLQTAQTISQNIRQLRNLRTSYNAGTEMIRRSQDALNRLDGIEDAATFEARTRDSSARKDALTKLRDAYISVIFKINQEEKTMARLAGVEESEGRATAAIKALKRRKALNILRVQHEHKRQIVVGAREQAVVWENRVTELIGAYNDELEMHGICPTCGQKINSQKVRSACNA